MLVCCFCSRIAAWTLLRLMDHAEGPCLKTRASAVNTLQKVSGLIRTGTLSMQWASSPPYSIQLGLVGYACFPLGSSTPNASAPSLLFLCMHQERVGQHSMCTDSWHPPSKAQEDTAACLVKLQSMTISSP